MVEAVGGGAIGTQVAAVSFDIQITAQDAGNNTVLGFDGSGNAVDISSTGILSAGSGTTATFTNGVLASHSVTISNTGSFTITATDSAGGLGTGTEIGVTNSFTVDPGPLDHFLVEAVGGGAIGSQVAAVSFDIQITAQDAVNNTVTPFDGAGNTVDIISTGTLSAGSGTTATFTNGVLGTHSVTITNTGSFTITATDSAGGIGSGTENGISNSFTVDPGVLDHFLVEAVGGGVIGTQVVAVSFDIQITALDAGNNSVTAFDGAGNTAEISSTGTLSAGSGTTATFTNGVLASHSVTISNNGSFTITATDSVGGLGTASETGVSNSFTVDAGALDHFLVEAVGGGAIGTQGAGVSFDIQITAQDAGNNTVTGFDGAGNTVDISSTGTLSAGSGTTATFTNGVLATHSVTITNTGSFTITATDSLGGLGTGAEAGVTNSFTVDPGPLDHFLVEAVGGGAIGTQTAAVSFDIQITAQDSVTNTITAFDGAGNTAQISSTGTLSAGSGTTATFTNGILASHSVTISNTGSFTITATDSGGGLGTGTETGVTNSFTVDPGALDHFLVEAIGGGAIGTQKAAVSFDIQITAQDAGNNAVTAFDGVGNTVDISSTGTLSAGSGTTATFTNGVLASHSVTISNTGNFTITATDSVGGLGTGAEAGASNSFTVNAGTLDHFLVEAVGGGAIATQIAAIGFDIQITAEDAGNNTITAFDGAGNTVDISSTGTLSVGSGTTASFTNGVLASHSVTITNTGNFTVTATHSAGGLGTGAEVGVTNLFTVDAGILDHFLVEAVGGGPIGTQTAGSGFSIQVTAQDALNNTVTAFNSCTADVSSTGTLTAGSGGTGPFINGFLASHNNVTISNTGSFTITVTDASGCLGTGTETGVTNSFTVDLGAMDHFLVEAVGGGVIGTQTAALSFDIQITAQDTNNNTITAFDGAGNTVEITSTGTLSAGSGTTVTFTNGVLASHSVIILNTGNFTITATDSVGGVGTGSESGVSNSFTVELTLDHFLVEAFGGGAIGTQTAATGFNIQITAQDLGNNTVTGFDGTVEITSTGTLSLGGGTTASFTNGVLASHSVTITNTGSFTITATDSVGGMGTGTETGVSNSFTVDAGALDHYLVEAVGGGAISTQSAGVAFNIQITAQDANNNTVTAFDGAGNTADITSTGTISAGSGTMAPFTNGFLASHSVTISNTGNFMITVTDSAGGLGTGSENGVSNSFTVNSGALDHYLVEAIGGGAIADQAVGIAFSIQITAQDGNNNTVTAFDGAGNTAEITSTGTLSAGGGTTATFTNGFLSSLSITFANTGSFTITATDSAGGLGTGAEIGVTNSFTVDPGPPAQLVFVTQPGSGTGGLALGTQPIVEVRDAQGNAVTSDPGAPNETVTMTFTVGTNGEGATLTGTTTVAINWTTGHASFTDLTVDLVGSYQLTASTNLGVFTTDSSAFTVTEGPPVQVAFSAQPSNAVSTVSIAPAIRVQVLDAGGNQVIAATNAITLGMSNNPGAGTLSGTLTVAAVNGEATFSDISIDKAGSGYTINASTTGLLPATSVGFDITGSIATQLLFSIPPSSAETGAAIVPTFQLEVIDAGGNLVTTSTNLITLAIGNNPSGGTLSGTFTDVAAVGGRATFSDISIDLAGNGYTLVASTTGLTPATSAPFNITLSISSQIAGIQTSVGVIQNELAIASQDTAVE